MEKIEEQFKEKISKLKRVRKNCEEEFEKFTANEKHKDNYRTREIKIDKSEEKLKTDSKLERKIINEIKNSSYIKSIKTQSYEIKYKKHKTYQPDIQLLLTDGSIALVEAKPLIDMVDEDNIKKYKALKKECKKEEKRYQFAEVDIKGNKVYSMEDIIHEEVSEKKTKKVLEFMEKVKEIEYNDMKSFLTENNINEIELCHIIYKNKQKIKLKIKNNKASKNKDKRDRKIYLK